MQLVPVLVHITSLKNPCVAPPGKGGKEEESIIKSILQKVNEQAGLKPGTKFNKERILATREEAAAALKAHGFELEDDIALVVCAELGEEEGRLVQVGAHFDFAQASRTFVFVLIFTFAA